MNIEKQSNNVTPMALLKGCLGVFIAIFVIIPLVVTLTLKDEPQKESVATPQQKEFTPEEEKLIAQAFNTKVYLDPRQSAHFQYYCQKAFENQLYPYKASFRNWRTYAYRGIIYSEVIIMGENAFGGTVANAGKCGLDGLQIVHLQIADKIYVNKGD